MGWRDRLSEPAVRSVDVDSDELLEVHRRILASKPMMRGVFDDIYDACMAADRRYFNGAGRRVEIGAGVSLFKQRYPEIISTDIKASSALDAVVDALAMPYEAGTVRAIYGINVFHHLPSPDRFFAELERVLGPGGGAVLVDPYHGPLARWLYPRLFTTEGYDLTQREWDAGGAMGVMHGANQALSWIVFVRDAALLLERHPGLEVVSRTPLTNYPRYLLSGGLNFRQLLPDAAIPALRACERVARPLARWFGLHHLIVIRKRS